MEAGVLCGVLRVGPTNKMVFEPRLEVSERGNQVDISGKDVPGRGTVGIKARR